MINTDTVSPLITRCNVHHDKHQSFEALFQPQSFVQVASVLFMDRITKKKNAKRFFASVLSPILRQGPQLIDDILGLYDDEEISRAKRQQQRVHTGVDSSVLDGAIRTVLFERDPQRLPAGTAPILLQDRGQGQVEA